MVSFDKTILPGGEGKINLKVNIKGKSGSIQKSVKVYSNDLENNETVLTIKAFIMESIKISSKILRFKGKEGEVLTQSIDITAQEEKPLNIKPSVFSLQEKMTYSIEEIEKGKAYKIIFTNLPQPVGRFNGSLKLMTNYDDNPEIIITIRGNFSKDSEADEEKQ